MEVYNVTCVKIKIVTYYDIARALGVTYNLEGVRYENIGKYWKRKSVVFFGLSLF